MHGKFWPSGVVMVAVLAVGFAQAAHCQTPYRLTLAEAIQKGLQRNLGVLVARARVEEAEGTRERQRASLMPRSYAETPVILQSLNLQAMGITVPIPGYPTVVGPFATYAAKVYLDQPLLDLRSYHAWKASDKQEQSTRNDYQDARDSVIRQIANLYLSAQSAAALVEAAESRTTDSEALYKLAKDRHDNGKATGVDVLRAQVQLATDQQSLLEARNNAKQALLVLARTIGLSPGTPLELAEPLRFDLLQSPDAGALLDSALAHRSDYLSLVSQRQALVEQQKANHARYLPRFSVDANYGPIGRNFGNFPFTGAAEVSMTIDLFDRDRQGEAKEIESRVRRVDDQMADLRLGVEQDLRSALLDLDSAAGEVAVAKQGLDLAQTELTLARDRFQQGVTDNLEVITAQDAVARAQQNYITALTRHVDAKSALARALGDTEKTYEHYLGVQ
ncbi:MAG TPA: TolC family protein [Terriglobia bacterium]|nr:TolC family protein [Terriglobia bacterium]